jgi:putative transposase
MSVQHERLIELCSELRRAGRKRALGSRTPMMVPAGINQRWSLDFVSDTLADGPRFRVLCVLDDFSRECLAAVVDTSLGGMRVVRELELVVSHRGWPHTIVSENELSKKAMAQGEHTTALARRASNAGYDCAIVEKTMPRPPVACVSSHRQGFARTARR